MWGFCAQPVVIWVAARLERCTGCSGACELASSADEASIFWEMGCGDIFGALLKTTGRRWKEVQR